MTGGTRVGWTGDGQKSHRSCKSIGVGSRQYCSVRTEKLYVGLWGKAMKRGERVAMEGKGGVSVVLTPPRRAVDRCEQVVT